MKLATIGVGNAGGKIVDRILRYELATDRVLCRSTLAINSAHVDLERLEAVPTGNRILIGQTHEQVRGHGAGADPDVGSEITAKDSPEIDRALDQVPIHEIDAFLVVGGLGGGTGSGGAPRLAEHMREIYDEPVYGLGVLPSADEGGRATLNAARSLPSFTESVDNLLLFDNDAWLQPGDSIEQAYERANWEIARRIVTLLAAGEVDGSQVSEAAMDSSDVRRTLATGGISTIAFAQADLSAGTRRSQGLLARFRNGSESADGNGVDSATKVHSLVRKAVRSRLTCPADVESAERSLAVISGPPQEFSQKGMQRARRWLEEETGSVEVLAGDDPRAAADSLTAAVLLSNVTDVRRIERLQERAVDARENVEVQERAREGKIQELVNDPKNELDPV